MKCKIIATKKQVKDIENEINSALASIGNIEIKYITQAYKQPFLVTTIFYED